MSSNVPFTEFLAAYASYAAPIRSHVAFADSRPEVRAALTETTRIAFLELISRTNIKDPLQPIWVRVDRTAERLGISEKSVSRTVKMMREKGWLKHSEKHDGRNNQGEFEGREFIVTRALRKLMALPESTSEAENSTAGGNINSGKYSPAAEPSSEAKAPIAHQLPLQRETPVAIKPPSDLEPGRSLSKAMSIVKRLASQRPTDRTEADMPPSRESDLDPPVEEPVDNPVLQDQEYAAECLNQTNLSDGVIYEVNKVFSLKEASLNKGAFFKDSKERQNPKLPADLISLQQEMDISFWGVCSLMKLAKEKGHRLQDVWKVKRDQLLNSGAKNGRAVQYLRFLLTCGEDFSYLARTKLPDQSPSRVGSRPAAPKNEPPAPAATPAPANASSLVQTGAVPSAITKLLEIAKGCRHKRFRHVSDSLFVRFYDGVAEVSRGVERATYAGWEMMEGLYVGISNGNLVEVRE